MVKYYLYLLDFYFYYSYNYVCCIIYYTNKEKENIEMKKFISVMAVAVLTTILCVVAAACSTTVEGVWKFSSMKMEAQGTTISYEAGKEYEGVTISADAVVITVNEDGTVNFKSTLMGQEVNQNGTWEMKDGKVILKLGGATQEGTLSGNVLTISSDVSGVKSTLVLKKA